MEDSGLIESLPILNSTFGTAWVTRCASVTWRDVTLCYSETPLLPGTTGHHRVIPGTTGWMISRLSPVSPSISSNLQESYGD
eukprot:668337-Amorphochlora_amoeboformis.AAC.1